MSISESADREDAKRAFIEGLGENATLKELKMQYLMRHQQARVLCTLEAPGHPPFCITIMVRLQAGWLDQIRNQGHLIGSRIKEGAFC